jgi:hypothetical protein
MKYRVDNKDKNSAVEEEGNRNIFEDWEMDKQEGLT